MSTHGTRSHNSVRYRTLPLFLYDLGSASHLLPPAAVLPEQFYDRSVGAQSARGEAVLMRAVLEDAVHCFQQQFIKHGPQVRRLATEAEEWLFTDDYRWPFSFVNICAVLGLNAEYVRRGLKRARQSPDARAKGRKQYRMPRRGRFPSPPERGAETEPKPPSPTAALGGEARPEEWRDRVRAPANARLLEFAHSGPGAERISVWTNS